jgi:uncharacterized membrane protein (UPF0127 family)
MSRRTACNPILAAAALALLLCLPLARAQDTGPAEPLSSFPRTQLRVTGHGGASHLFDVWIADTPQRSQQGLMFVSDLPDNKGMVFPLDPPRVENMWMKNTYIELDMLFVRSDGRVGKIIERAHPLSEEILSSDAPVAAVLELRGGLAAKLGLKVGDLVRWDKPASR